LAELGEQTGVGGWKGVVGKLGAGDPGQAFAVDGPGFVAQPAAEEEFEADGAFGIVMEEVREEGDYRDFDAEFFAEFASEAVFEGFSVFAFATGEFPQAGKVGTGGAAGDEEAGIAEDKGGGNFDWRLRGANLGAGRIVGTNPSPWPSPRSAGRGKFSFGSTESRPTGIFTSRGHLRPMDL
jgi:hypothetical protein